MARLSTRRTTISLVLAALAVAVTARVLWTGPGPADASGVAPRAAASDGALRADDEPLTVTRLVETTTATPSVMASTTADGSRLEVTPTSRLTVRVKSARKPLSRAKVRILLDGVVVGVPEDATTGRRGRAVFDVPADTMVAVSVSVRNDPGPFEWSATTAPAGDYKTLVVNLSRVSSARSHTLAVHTFPSGQPLGDATVSVHSLKDDKLGKRLDRAQTKEDGTVTLTWQPGVTYVVTAPGHTTQAVTGPDSLNAAVQRVDLNACARLFGTLERRGVNGERRLGHVPFIRIGPPPELGRFQRDSYRPTAGIQTKCSRDGTWEITGIEFDVEHPVRRNVFVSAHVGGSWRCVASGLTIRPGEEIEVADTFGAAPALDVQLRYAEDEPWTGSLTVAFVPAGSLEFTPQLRASVSRTGHLKAPHLPTGYWDMYMTGAPHLEPGRPFATFQHRNSEPREVIAEGLVPMRGTVLGASTGESTRSIVRLKGNSQFRIAHTGRDDVFDLSPVRRGLTYSIIAQEVARNSPQIIGEGGVVLIDGNGDIWDNAFITGDPNHPTREVQVVATGQPITIRL